MNRAPRRWLMRQGTGGVEGDERLASRLALARLGLRGVDASQRARRSLRDAPSVEGDARARSQLSSSTAVMCQRPRLEQNAVEPRKAMFVGWPRTIASSSRISTTGVPSLSMRMIWLGW